MKKFKGVTALALISFILTTLTACTSNTETNTSNQAEVVYILPGVRKVVDKESSVICYVLPRAISCVKDK